MDVTLVPVDGQCIYKANMQGNVTRHKQTKRVSHHQKPGPIVNHGKEERVLLGDGGLLPGVGSGGREGGDEE